MITQKIKNLLIWFSWTLWRKTFLFWERFGFHIIPNSFYQVIPDTRTLKNDLWAKPGELIGINLKEKEQLALLGVFEEKYKDEYSKFSSEPTQVPSEYYFNNQMFGPVDAEILYSMIRHFKPKNIFEIGSGFTTFLMARAVLKNKNEGHDCKLISHDPYSNEIIKQKFPGFSELKDRKVEEADLNEFLELEANDLLFIDSSHALRIGGDVWFEYLKILPRLKPGVIIHIHDIFLPAEYPREWVLKYFRFWNEQYLLQAFLTLNDSFEVLWAGHYVHSKFPEKLESAFNSYDRKKIGPVSFWIRRVK